MCRPRFAQLFERDVKRAVFEPLRSHIPRAGKAVHVGDRIPLGADNVRETLEVLAEDEVFDERLFPAGVSHGISQWSSGDLLASRALLDIHRNRCGAGEFVERLA